jgi:hypothetical protein
MSDTGDLVSLVGELDREIERLDPERAAAARAAAAELIPPLGAEGAAGWYDRLVAVAGPPPEEVTLTDALRALSRPPESRRVLARRVLAIGAVARALPERFGPDGEEGEAVRLALSGPGILRSAPPVSDDVEPEPVPPIRDEAPGFHRNLVDRELLPDLTAFRQFVEHDANRTLVHSNLRGLPPPCATALVDVPGSAEDADAVTLVTRVCITGVTLAQVEAQTGFLNPGNWANYDYWCGMVRHPDDANKPYDDASRYLEIVALDCPNSWFKVAVWLDFSRLERRPGKLYRDYTMSAQQMRAVGGQTSNGAVTVDEGSLLVVDEGGHLRVTTTKRIRFTTGIDPDDLAVVACVAGYGDLSTAFVVEGTGGQATDVACPPGGADPFGGKPGVPVEDPVEHSLEDLERTAGDCVTAGEAAVTKVRAGGYTADDLAADLAGSFVRTLRAWGQLVGLAVAVAQPPRRLLEVTSDEFPLPAPATAGCRLELARPLRSAWGGEVPPRQVLFDPEPLPAGATSFSFRVPAAGLRGATYAGDVNVFDPASPQVDVVPVDIQIP